MISAFQILGIDPGRVVSTVRSPGGDFSVEEETILCVAQGDTHVFNDLVVFVAPTRAVVLIRVKGEEILFDAGPDGLVSYKLR